MTTTAQVKITQCVPYIFFYGRCEEALEFYKNVFGGKWEGMRVKDTPMAAQMPQETGNNIMHASFTSSGVNFQCSDGDQKKIVDPDEGNVSLSITAADAADGERVCKALAEGGKLVQPFGDAFWGGKFGMVNDRFGTQWMITSD